MAKVSALDRLTQRTQVADACDPQRAPEGSTPLRQCETCRGGVHMRAPARLPAARVGHDLDLMVRADCDRDNPQQLGGVRPLSATDAGPH
jgi:hypothetical protein